MNAKVGLLKIVMTSIEDTTEKLMVINVISNQILANTNFKMLMQISTAA